MKIYMTKKEDKARAMRPISENGGKRIELVKSNIVENKRKREEDERKQDADTCQPKTTFCVASFLFPHQLPHTPPAQLASLCSSLNPLRHAMEKTNNSRNYLREKKKNTSGVLYM